MYSYNKQSCFKFNIYTILLICTHTLYMIIEINILLQYIGGQIRILPAQNLEDPRSNFSWNNFSQLVFYRFKIPSH